MKIPYFEEGDELADGYKFLNKPTIEQLLEKMDEETELSEDEKTSLKGFFDGFDLTREKTITDRGKVLLKDLEKKSKYKCMMRTSKCSKIVLLKLKKLFLI